ncbi:MAG: hypothetical protein M3N52_00280 [Actinomycetota bacterium]|nr:hypothetical protein [Actinomycetota bacterium]
MSKGSRKKRATRPWQNPEALRDIGDLVTQPGLDEDLRLDGYEVRRVDAGRAAKDYVCPECGNRVPAEESHVVVWPEDDSDLRRHWHRHCWRLEVRRSAGGDW